MRKRNKEASRFNVIIFISYMIRAKKSLFLTMPFYMKTSDENNGQTFSLSSPFADVVDKNFSLYRAVNISKKMAETLNFSGTSDFQLSQMRTKFSWSSDVGWRLATVNANSALELQFLRREQ